jgi:hypothetical protein
MAIVFLHVGEDQLVNLFVESIRRSCGNIQIIQCTDLSTPEVKGVDNVFRYDGDIKNLMTFRLKCFSELKLNIPAIYLDTDMLVVKDLNDLIINCGKIGLCRRDFNRNALFNTNFNGMNLSEYSGMTLDEVYPYIACCTLTPSFEFWSEASSALDKLDRKYHFWYGDQEAIRKVAKNIKSEDMIYLPESIYGCLPEHVMKFDPKIIHFKGAARKSLMRDFIF